MSGMKSAPSRIEARRRLAGSLLRDRSGAALVEFTLVAPLLFLLTFGLVDFGNAFFQWNEAAKAAQLGARLAAVSSPVWSALSSLQGTENGNSGAAAGAAWPATDNYGVSCSGSPPTCAAISGTAGLVGQAATASATALNNIVYGRGQTTCGGALGGGQFPGMCDLFNRITPANVVIEYRYSGLGYVARPEGPIPTIVLKLTGLTFQFIALNGFLGLGPITMPDFKVTITGEDISSNCPGWNGTACS
jgi:Flp pilus assembly protein TadG